MTPERQRIAIATAIKNWEIHHGGKYCAIKNCKNPTLNERLFDPLEDLNACHEMEKALTESQQIRYRQLLACNSDGRRAVFATAEAAMCHATAAQRKDAFLRTLNLWEETK